MLIACTSNVFYIERKSHPYISEWRRKRGRETAHYAIQLHRSNALVFGTNHTSVLVRRLRKRPIFGNSCKTCMDMNCKNISNGQRFSRQIDFGFQQCNMYFIVYVVGAREHVIIPVHWVNNYKAVFEKSIKYALNSNQKHLCFYTPTADINVGAKHKPNFHLPVGCAIVNGDCCFHGMIVNFFSKYLTISLLDYVFERSL